MTNIPDKLEREWAAIKRQNPDFPFLPCPLQYR